jgi:hypothetical protein
MIYLETCLQSLIDEITRMPLQVQIWSRINAGLRWEVGARGVMDVAFRWHSVGLMKSVRWR